MAGLHRKSRRQASRKVLWVGSPDAGTVEAALRKKMDYVKPKSPLEQLRPDAGFHPDRSRFLVPCPRRTGDFFDSALKHLGYLRLLSAPRCGFQRESDQGDRRQRTGSVSIYPFGPCHWLFSACPTLRG